MEMLSKASKFLNGVDQIEFRYIADVFCRNPNDAIRIYILFPSLFKDTGRDHTVHTFMAQKGFCRSSYKNTTKSEEHFTEICEVADEFSVNNFKPSLNGDFVFKLLNKDLDRTQIAKLQIRLEGSMVPFMSRLNK